MLYCKGCGVATSGGIWTYCKGGDAQSLLEEAGVVDPTKMALWCSVVGGAPVAQPCRCLVVEGV